MLKVYALVNNRRTLFLGLERANAEKMLVGEPVVVDLQALLAQSTLGPVQDLVISMHETLREAHEEWSRYMPLPPFQEPAPGEPWRP